MPLSSLSYQFRWLVLEQHSTATFPLRPSPTSPHHLIISLSVAVFSWCSTHFAAGVVRFGVALCIPFWLCWRIIFSFSLPVVCVCVCCVVPKNLHKCKLAAITCASNKIVYLQATNYLSNWVRASKPTSSRFPAQTLFSFHLLHNRVLLEHSNTHSLTHAIHGILCTADKHTRTIWGTRCHVNSHYRVRCSCESI